LFFGDLHKKFPTKFLMKGDSSPADGFLGEKSDSKNSV
jgi:hypothetical protein